MALQYGHLKIKMFNDSENRNSIFFSFQARENPKTNSAELSK